MNNNHGNLSAPPPLDVAFDVHHSFFGNGNSWLNETHHGDNLDQSMPQIQDDLIQYPGMTPPQTVSHSSAGNNEAPSFESMLEDTLPSSTTNGEQLSMNSVDSIDMPSFGEHKNNSDTTQNDNVSFDQNNNVAEIFHDIAIGTTIQSNPTPIVAVQSADHHNNTNQLSAAISKVSTPLDKVSNSPCVQASAAALKSKTKGHAKNSSKQTQSLWRDSWCKKFDLLKAYKDKNGNCDVPQKLPLGPWVNKQRNEKTKLDKGVDTTMNREKCERLESIGFKWATPKGQAAWNKRFEELKEYKQKHGDCIVPTKYKDNSALGRWVTSQRADKKQGVMNKDNEKKIDDIGFVWDRYDKKETKERS